MSSAMFATMATPSALPADTYDCCPSCGLSSADQTQIELLRAQARIADLETQVRLLNQKATAAVDRWADYEDELSRLRSEVGTAAHPPPPPPPPPPKEAPRSPPPSSSSAEMSPTRTSFLQAGTNRLSQLLYPRKSTPTLRRAPTPDTPTLPAAATTARPPHSRTTSGTAAAAAAAPEDLLEALTREQSLRKQAEGRLTDSSREIEELSVALFEQANEMVADERRARAKLEERVGELERRDVEKRRRLEKLEMAMIRIERVRNLLNEDDDSDISEDDGGIDVVGDGKGG